MARLLILAVVLLLVSIVQVKSKEEEDETLVKVVSDTVDDVSKISFKDLKAKYGPNVVKSAIGTALGYTVTYVVKTLAISVIKAVSVGVGLFAVAVIFGWVGKDKTDQLKGAAAAAEEEMYHTLDMNEDGKINLMDLRAALRRAERALLKQNIPSTLGAIAGGVIALASSTFNPFD